MFRRSRLFPRGPALDGERRPLRVARCIETAVFVLPGSTWVCVGPAVVVPVFPGVCRLLELLYCGRGGMG